MRMLAEHRTRSDEVLKQHRTSAPSLHGRRYIKGLIHSKRLACCHLKNPSFRLLQRILQTRQKRVLALIIRQAELTFLMSRRLNRILIRALGFLLRTVGLSWAIGRGWEVQELHRQIGHSIQLKVRKFSASPRIVVSSQCATMLPRRPPKLSTTIPKEPSPKSSMVDARLFCTTTVSIGVNLTHQVISASVTETGYGGNQRASTRKH